MKRILCWIIVFAWSGYVTGEETASWDLANNTVTYSTESTFGRNTPTSVALSQFNSLSVAAQEGGGDFILSKVVLTLDGSINAVLTYENTTASSQDVTVQSVGGGSWFTYAPLNITSATENYAISHDFGTVASGASVVVGDPDPIQASGSGAVSSGDITTDLAGFLGDGSIQTTVTFGSMFWDWGAEGSKNETLVRSAEMSVTYDYDAVPEPTGVSLFLIGAAALLLRRRSGCANTDMRNDGAKG